MHQQCTGGLDLGFQLCVYTEKSLPELSFIFIWDPNHLLSYFWQDTRPWDKAIQHFNLLPFSAAWPPSVTSPMCQVQGWALDYGPVKLGSGFLCSLVWRLQHSFFHIFGDLEDFSWTDSKWSSFSYKGKTLKENQLTKIPVRF